MRKGFPLCDWLDKTDRLVNVPKFKTHGYTILTAGIKNLFGLVVGMNKMKIHRDFPNPEGLSGALVSIYEARKPDLTVLDGIVAMEGEGPGSAGRLRQMELIAASGNALALDMVLAVIMGIAPMDVPTNRQAVKKGLLPASFPEIGIEGEDIKFFIGKDFLLPQTSFLSKMPGWATAIVRKMLSMRTVILKEHCRMCGLCAKSCPVLALHKLENRMVIDNKACILCLCCREVCPHRAIEVERNFFMRMLTR